MEYSDAIPQWAESLNCAITVCDENCKIIFMNRKSRETFCKHGDLIGNNLLECHSPRSCEIIHRLLSDGGTNSYTIEKNGLFKMIYQTAWRKADGSVGGLVEISMVIPENMPHYKRD